MTDRQMSPPTEGDEGAPPTTVERLSKMTHQEVDDLPYGFIVLDSEGVVHMYNRYEERMSRIAAERVVGRNFFRDIAPCTRVEAFVGRFRALAARPLGASDRFSFRFHFMHGAQDVLIQLARAPGDRVFMTVHRRVLEARPSEDLPMGVRHEPERGRLTSPLGPLFAITWEQMPALLAASGVNASRELGRRTGRALVQVAQRRTASAGVNVLGEAPAQLAASSIDESLAQLGFGRLACDFSNRPRHVACYLRPPVECSSAEIAGFYEGLIEVALTSTLGAPHVVRCIEGTALEAAPWRFAVVPIEFAEELHVNDGEGPDDLARRFGMLPTAADGHTSGS
jgi:photoactive yellow protein